jgi:uridine kinase
MKPIFYLVKDLRLSANYLRICSLPCFVRRGFLYFSRMKQKPYIIGITGGSGSGKTSFLKELRLAYTPLQVCFISQDDFYHPKTKQKKDAKGIVNYDLPDSIDQKKLAAIIRSLVKGKSYQLEEYTFNVNKKKRLITYIPAPIILVEGLFVFYSKAVHRMLDLKLFIEAKENLKVIRRIKRDQVERALPLEMVLYQYEKHVLPAFEKYILPFRDEVDIIINNNEGFDQGLAVIKGFIDSKLKP